MMMLIELALVLIYLCVLLLKSCEMSESLCFTYGFGHSPSGIFQFFVFVGLSMLLLQLIIEAGSLLHIIAQERRVHAIRLRLNHRQPELALREGHLYHLFLSHVWSTAQDTVSVIKRQLQLLMPVRCRDSNRGCWIHLL